MSDAGAPMTAQELLARRAAELARPRGLVDDEIDVRHALFFHTAGQDYAVDCQHVLQVAEIGASVDSFRYLIRLRKYIAGSCLIRHRGRYRHSCRDGLENQYEQ